MNERARGALALLVLALIAGAAFFGGRYWQSAGQAPTRVEAVVGCDLRAGPCQQSVAGGRVKLSITPAQIPLMKPLRLVLSTEDIAVTGVVVEIRGLNMEMGLNRTRLERTGASDWSGETILPICSQRGMEWEAAVQLEMEGRFEVPFRFQTTRP